MTDNLQCLLNIYFYTANSFFSESDPMYLFVSMFLTNDLWTLSFWYFSFEEEIAVAASHDLWLLTAGFSFVFLYLSFTLGKYSFVEHKVFKYVQGNLPNSKNCSHHASM